MNETTTIHNIINNLEDGNRVYIDIANTTYFVIYDYDVSIYKGSNMILRFGTYPINPRETLKQITSWNNGGITF